MEKFLYDDLNELESSHWWHLAKRESVSQVIKKSTISNPKILDIGCGTGQNMAELASVGSVAGVDISPQAIKYCKKKGLKNVRLGMSHKTGHRKEFFHFVTLLDVLEHVEESETLKEISRILKKDGSLIITVPAFSWLWSRWDEILHHKRRYTRASLEKVLRKNGFKVKKITYMYSFLIIPALLVRFLKSFNTKGEYSSDFKLSSPVINKIFLQITKLERLYYMNFFMPFGTSLICVATKRKISKL